MLETKVQLPSPNRQHKANPYWITSNRHQIHHGEKEDSLLLKNSDVQKSFDYLAMRNFRITQCIRKQYQTESSVEETPSSQKKTWTEKSPNSHKMLKYGNKFSLHKYENMFGKIFSYSPSFTDVSHLKPKPVKKAKGPKKGKNVQQELIKIPSVSLNSQAMIQKKEPEYILVPETFAQKSHDSYTHFKKTLSSFWTKNNSTTNTTGTNNSGILFPHQRCNSAAINPDIISKRDPISDHYAKILLLEERDRRVPGGLTKKHHLSFARIEVNEGLPSNTTKVSPSDLVPSQTHIDKSANILAELGSNRKFEDKGKLEDIKSEILATYANIKAFKPIKSKYSNPNERSSSRNNPNDSIKVRESIVQTTQSTEFEIKQTPSQPKSKKSIKDSELESNRRKEPIRHIKQKVISPESRKSSKTSMTSQGIRRKLKEISSPEREYGVFNNTESCDKGMSITTLVETKPVSFIEDKLVLPIQTPEGLDLGKIEKIEESKSRSESVPVNIEKRSKTLGERSLTSKFSPSQRENLFKDIDNLQIEGWDQVQETNYGF